MSLTPQESRRYARHIVLKGVGAPGQQKLKRARVLIVGAGGLGSPVIAYLAAAGVGTLTIADGDTVSESNLQRQVVHTTQNVGKLKADSAAEFVTALNPMVKVIVHRAMIDDAGDAATLCGAHDLVVEGTDNFSARKLLAEACQAEGVPLVSGAVTMFDGQLTVFAPHLTGSDGMPLPRFSDLYPQSPDEAALPSCEMVGILGATTGVIGTLMAMEAIKLIAGVGDPLFGRLLMYDGRATRFTEFAYRRRS